MAKQKGLHKLAGKVDEQSYYYSKNGGYQSRKINPGIGERVKSAPEYANTRLNNAEFGAAGACAGAMIREVTKRWRFILDSIATGKMVKVIKDLMTQDSSNPWGERAVALADMPKVQEAYTRLSKNQMPERIVIGMASDFSFDASSNEIVISHDLTLGTELSDYLASIGADTFNLKAYVLSVKSPEYSALTKKYLPISANLAQFAEFNPPSNSPTEKIWEAVEIETSQSPLSTQSFISGVLLIFEPYRVVGGNTYVLQQHCAAIWKTISAAE